MTPSHLETDGDGVIVCPAYAKLNLVLEVLGRRPDGYHQVLTVLQAIDLHDTVSVAPARALTLRCDDPSLANVDNLAYRAALALRQRYGVGRGASIAIAKRIPVAAGLGGGSADAAATLLALDRLWGLSLPEAELAAVGAGLGSDVPFCLRGGTALAGGRGEALAPLPAAPQRWLVLLCPPLTIPAKTATLYRRLSPATYDDGARARSVAEALRRGEFPAEGLLVNTFAKVADEAFPGLAAARAALEAVAPGPAHLSGAGPSLFVFFSDEQAALKALASLRERGVGVYLARTGAWRPTAVIEQPL
ncbi:MAG: 4-(cytidine 5'-diphospho)-2-C-methyl-D-erythritol kinase [Chloroflexota bacterium]